MALEQQSCCGAITATYADAGRRKHYPDCWNATAGNIVERPHVTGAGTLECCGAPSMVSAQTGRHYHFEDCDRAEPETGTISRTADPEPADVDPAEHRRMTVQVETIIERGLWMAYCAETGTNEWARNEGQVRDGEMLPLSEAQAVRIGLFVKPGTSSRW